MDPRPAGRQAFGDDKFLLGIELMHLESIKSKIEGAVPNSTAYVLDPMNDGQHLQAYVVSPVFEGMPTFKQQQLVMTAIKDVFQTVHALGLKTFTPQKWQEVKNQYVN